MTAYDAITAAIVAFLLCLRPDRTIADVILVPFLLVYALLRMRQATTTTTSRPDRVHANHAAISATETRHDEQSVNSNAS